MRNKLVVALMAGVLGSAGGARADVTWEHTVTARWSLAPQPVLQAKIYNNWTPQRHRVLVKYAVPDDPFAPRYRQSGSVAAIQRLDDDRVIAYASQPKTFLSESRSALLEKLKVNVWQGWEPELAQQTAPSFTPEQRARLGAELRAAYAPFTRAMVRPYFRALPQTRVLNNRLARGYRLTWLLNTSGEPGNESGWTRVAMEWWLAPHEASDDEIAGFYREATAPLRQPGGLTNSIWLNEALPVLWAAMPRELQRAVATLQPPQEAQNALSGAPLRAYLTVQPPQDGIAVGTLRAELALTARHTRELSPSVWEAPAGYKRFSGEELDQGMEQTFETPLVQQAMRQMIVASAGAVER